ncbi:hypothetical protein KR018_012566, partial [Drosophila ironensis]
FVDLIFNMWSFTKKVKRMPQKVTPLKNINGNWCRSLEEQVQTFAEHLGDRFTAYNFASEEDVNKINEILQRPFQLSPPIRHISLSEVSNMIRTLKRRKAPGHDLISNAVLKILPMRALLFITLIFNAIFQYFPKKWKSARISMILKPGKPEQDPS